MPLKQLDSSHECPCSSELESSSQTLRRRSGYLPVESGEHPVAAQPHGEEDDQKQGKRSRSRERERDERADEQPRDMGLRARGLAPAQSCDAVDSAALPLRAGRARRRDSHLMPKKTASAARTSSRCVGVRNPAVMGLSRPPGRGGSDLRLGDAIGCKHHDEEYHVGVPRHFDHPFSCVSGRLPDRSTWIIGRAIAGADAAGLRSVEQGSDGPRQSHARPVPPARPGTRP